MKKILSVLLVAVMICTLFAACNNGGGEEQVAKVTVSIVADDTKILDNVSVEIEGVDGEAPLAIDAIINALNDYEIEHDEVEFAGTLKLEKIGDYDTENNNYIWELYLNGDDEPASGRLALVEVEDGDKILVQRNAYESVVSSDTEDVLPSEPEEE